MLVRMIVHTCVFAGVLAVLLFLPAGTVEWPQGWIFIALFVGCSEATGVWLLALGSPGHRVGITAAGRAYAG